MLSSGLLRDGTSTKKESFSAQISPWRRLGDWQATCTSHKKLLDGLCVFESWKKECKRAR